MTALLVAGATACNAAAKDDASSDSSAGSASFTLVTPDAVGQNEFLKLAVTGVKAAAKAHNGTEKVFESSDTASQQQNVDAAVDAKPDVVVRGRLRVRRPGRRRRPRRNPDQQFLFDRRVHHRRRSTTSPARCSASTRASTSPASRPGCSASRGKVGAVVALDTPLIRRFATRSAAGAQQVAPNTEIAFTPLYVGGQNPFNDPARAKEQAHDAASQGLRLRHGGRRGRQPRRLRGGEGRARSGVRRRRQPVPDGARARSSTMSMKRDRRRHGDGIAKILGGDGRRPGLLRPQGGRRHASPAWRTASTRPSA